MYDGGTFCEVFQCYSREHERNEHKCVRCKTFGHGHRECPKKNYEKSFLQEITKNM